MIAKALTVKIKQAMTMLIFLLAQFSELVCLGWVIDFQAFGKILIDTGIFFFE